MRCYETFELDFQGEVLKESWAIVDLTATFTNGNDTWSVRGFYDGDGKYKVRFLPQKTGHYTWKVTGIFEAAGEAECLMAADRHGMVKAESHHFVYQDGSRYMPFGTTIYALSHQPEKLIEETMETLANAPFNKVRHCVFPKHYDYNHNEPEFYPFEKDKEGKWDVHRPCFAYWNHLEQVINRLSALGIESDLILFHSYDRWGFSLLSMEENRVYLDYLLRRLSAIPSVWWSMANEYDLLFNRTIQDWYEIETFIKENDPYGHLLSNHNALKYYDNERENITHCSIQTMAMHRADQWQTKYGKPVIYDECCYEGDIQHEWGNISGFELVNRFWKACAKGSYVTHGETFYSEDEVLWWAKGGKLKGKSPQRIGYLKDILYGLPSCIEAWEEPVYEDYYDPAEAGEALYEHPFFKLIGSLTPEDKDNLNQKSANYTGHCGDDVFLKYFAHQCVRLAYIRLPKDKDYKIEVIDAWNMTREVLIERASGKTELHLPGKEGIAVLCTRL